MNYTEYEVWQTAAMDANAAAFFSTDARYIQAQNYAGRVIAAWDVIRKIGTVDPGELPSPLSLLC